MEATVIITNSHTRGFSFGHAIDPVNEQVFIPAHVAEGMNLQPSDRIKAVLVPNYADKSTNGTAYMTKSKRILIKMNPLSKCLLIKMRPARRICHARKLMKRCLSLSTTPLSARLLKLART